MAKRLIQDIIPEKKQPQLAKKISKKPVKEEVKPAKTEKEEKKSFLTTISSF